ncbi:MAG: magnesium/cobalt transporter CorA [Gammaproteobacteria bacterium]
MKKKKVSLESASQKTGFEPGTVVHVGERQAAETKIGLIEFDKTGYREQDCTGRTELMPSKYQPTVSWFHVTGLHDVDLIEGLGRDFGIHQLVLEDVVNTHQRPKVEEFDHYLFIVFRAVRFDPDALEFDNEQISLIVGCNFILSFEESESDLLRPVVGRIKNSRGKFRSQGADYLAYSIIDLIVDRYFLIEDQLDEVVEALEDELLATPEADMLGRIQKLKRGMIFLRRAVSPLREVLTLLLRTESELIEESTKVYIRDIYDHAVRVIEGLDSYRDLIAGLLEIYLSSISNKMNEIMKVLTVFATIFIPLTFLAGVYGMNFEFIPELKWHWAYPAFWSVCLVTGSGLLAFFRRKKWL